jgi:protein-disulfide isomerase
MTKYNKFLKSPSGKILGLTAILFMAILGYYYYAINTGASKKAPKEQAVTVSDKDYTKGSPNAQVNIIEYADFQCPACKAYESVVSQILKKYPEDVRFTFRHFPLISIHKNALLAATYAEAAGEQGKFWEMHDALYANQSEWGDSLDAEKKILGYGASLGLNVAMLEKTAKSDAVREKVVASYKEASILKLQGTPSFFVNGNKVESSNLIKEVDSAVSALKK